MEQKIDNYIFELIDLMPVFQVKKELIINRNCSVNAYNFDSTKKEILVNFLGLNEHDLKSADGFYYDKKDKTIYLIEWTESNTQERKPQDFAKKFSHSILILGFLTACTNSNFREMTLKCWAIHSRDCKTKLPTDRLFSKLETCLKKVFKNAEVRYNSATNTKDELNKLQSRSIN